MNNNKSDIKPFSDIDFNELIEYLNLHHTGDINLSDHWNIGDKNTQMFKNDVSCEITGFDETIGRESTDMYDKETYVSMLIYFQDDRSKSEIFYFTNKQAYYWYTNKSRDRMMRINRARAMKAKLEEGII